MEKREFDIGTKMTGIVKTYSSKFGDEYCLEINPDQVNTDYRFIVPQSELDIIYQPRIEEYFGKRIAFLVKDIDDKNKFVLVSRKANLERKREILIYKLETGDVIEATVYKIAPFGCYLRYHDIPLILRNKDFSTDYTPVADVLHRGDVIKCRLVEVSKSRRVFVAPEEKYTSEPEIYKFEAGQKVVGTITTITGFGYFVRIGVSTDVLCPIDGYEFNKQDKVIIEIKQVREDGKYRGKILGRYKEEKDVMFDVDDLPD